MASPLIDVHCDVPDPAEQPATFTEACARIDELLRANMVGADAYKPYLVSNTTPSVSDQDKVWLQTDSSGRPIATKLFYGGNWRAVYSGSPSEVKMFIGDPALYFDATGRGTIGGLWDGWALMNGQNGTPNWSDKFVVGAHMDGTGGIAKFSAGWQTGVTGVATKTGGSAIAKLFPSQVPWPGTPAVIVDLFQAASDERNDSGAMFGKHSSVTGPTGTHELLASTPAHEADPWSLCPPYITAAYVMFIGY